MRRCIHLLAILAFPACSGDQAASSRPPGFVAHMPATENFVFVPNPLQSLGAFARSAFFERLASLLTPGGSNELVRMLDENGDSFPLEIAAGMSSAGPRLLGRVFGVYFLSELFEASAELDVEERKLVKRELHEELDRQLAAFEFPDLHLWWRFASRAQARDIFKQIRAKVVPLAPTFGLRVKREAEGLTTRLRLGDYLDAESVGEVTSEMGFEDIDPERLDAIVDRLGAIELSGRLALCDAALLLSIGPRVEEPQRLFTAEELAPLIERPASLVASARWETKGARESIAGTLRLWDRWKAHRLGAIIRAKDAELDEPVLLDLRVVERQARTLSDRGFARLDRAPNLEFVLEERGGLARSPALASAAIASYVPESAGLWSVNTTASLPEHLAFILDNLESRIDRDTFRAEVDGSNFDKRWVELGEQYYRSMRGLRLLLFGERASVFEPSAGWVVTNRGRLERFGLDLSPGHSMSLKGRTLPELCMLGFTRDPAKARAYIADIARSLHPSLDEGLVDLDLGFDLPTHGFAASAQASLLEGWTLQGDARVHVVEDEGVLLVSTSPRLTREMLASHRARDEGEAPPLAGLAAGTVGLGRMDWTRFGELIANAGSLVTDAMGAEDSERRVVKDAGAVFATLGRAEWTFVEDGGVRRSHFRLRRN